MPSDCCYFVVKAAAADAAPALNYFSSILHRSAVFTQNLGQTRGDLPDTGEFIPQKDNGRIVLGWLPREQLADLEIYPDFIKEQIFHLDAPPRHFITRV